MSKPPFFEGFYLLENERERERRDRGDRGRGKESQADSGLSMEPNVGFHLMTLSHDLS